MALLDHTASELQAMLAAREVASVELAEAFLTRIESVDRDVGAFLNVDGDQAMQTARGIDERRANGAPVGKLAGIPIAIKDNLCHAGQETTCASRMLAEFRPPYDATVVARLKSSDAVLVGHTNMDEFAMGSTTETSAVRRTANPWNLGHTPGGSSGGSAAAVAAQMVPWAVGSDTGGSIRQPAAYCGVVGMKPTYGRVSRYGLVAFASSLDQIGPFARTAQDAALLLEVLAGHDAKDATSLDQPVPNYSQSVDRPLEKLRLGICEDQFQQGIDEEIAAAVRKAIDVYESLGAEIIPLSLPHSRYAVATYYVIAPCEASSNLARYDGVHYGFRAEGVDAGAATADDSPLISMYRRTRGAGFGSEVKRRIMLGTYALSAGYYDAYYLKALKVRRLIRQDLDEAFTKVDMIAGPVSPAPPAAQGELADDPLAMYLQDLYTTSANLSGIPGISVPCGFTSVGLPIGLQLLGPPLGEESLLRGAAMYQSATDWHKQSPPLGADKNNA